MKIRKVIGAKSRRVFRGFNSIRDIGYRERREVGVELGFVDFTVDNAG